MVQSSSDDQSSSQSSLDLASYFSGLPQEPPPDVQRPKKSILNPRPVRSRLPNRRSIGGYRHIRSPQITQPNTPTEEEVEEEEDQYVNQKWNELINRQKQTEAKVRKMILDRNRLDPIELSKWLDSKETCELPLPSYGVQIRMIDHQNDRSENT